MVRRLAAAALAALAFAAHAVSFPPYVSLPVPVPADAVNHETYGQAEFTLRDKTEIHKGKYWSAYMPYTQKLGEDPRKALVAFIEAMQKAGWQVVLRDEPSNPPIASFHYTRDGKDAWALISTGEDAKVTVVESSGPSAKLDLQPPAAPVAKPAANADFPFLKRFPGSKLAETVDDDRPFMVPMEPSGELVQVASGAWLKNYEGPAHLSGLELVAVYSDALKRAGWTLVEENTALTTGDPYLTAHFVRGTIDIWAHVHMGSDGYSVRVADASAERGAKRMKAEIDRACKVPVYGLNFDFDKATLRADSEAALNSILEFLNAYPDLKVELAGHTDNVGKPDYNVKLSDARVNTVRGWLVGKGVKAERLTAKGYGASQPVADNDSPEGRAKNRRVELRKAGCAR
jgi:outer membrane protein OmpA-like peptidoglycan-associated protein